MSRIDLTFDATRGLRPVCHYCCGPVQAPRLDVSVEKGFRIPSGGQTALYHLTVCVDSASPVPPSATDTEVGFINMPIDACSAAIFSARLVSSGRNF